MIEINLSTTKDNGGEQEVCKIERPRRNRQNSRKDSELPSWLEEVSLDKFSKLFDKNLLAELTSEDTWMDRLKRVIERGEKPGFYSIGPHTDPLWNQMALQDDCVLVDNRLAVAVQLRPTVLK